jgi:hypothetical protein
MTEGSISKKLILFAIPLFLGQLLQQLYNVVDSIVVGNVLGKEALAAVSTTGSLIFLLVGFINGLFMEQVSSLEKGMAPKTMMDYPLRYIQASPLRC